MSDAYPKVSVLIPHYNMHDYLPNAIQSVANQDYPNIELIIIDDGSDHTLDQTQLSDIHIDYTFLEIDHSGKPQAVNNGFELATGDYFTILDADDKLPPKSILQRITALKNHKADLCIGSFEVHYDGSRQAVRSISYSIPKIKQEIIRDFLGSIISPFHQNAMLFSKELLQRVSGMDPQMLRGQDKDFAVRLIKSSKGIAYVKTPVYIYNRYHRNFSRRIFNRVVGTKFKLIVLNRHLKGIRKLVYLIWETCIGLAKLAHDVFGIYKK